jgi:hypothetical protein
LVNVGPDCGLTFITTGADAAPAAGAPATATTTDDSDAVTAAMISKVRRLTIELLRETTNGGSMRAYVRETASYPDESSETA